MKSVKLPSGSTYFAHEHNALRSDAAAAASLHVHQQLGALALGTTPSNTQTVTLDINGTNVVFTAVTGTPTNPGDVKAPGTAAGFVANLYAALINPTVSTTTFIALSAANAILVQYLGYGLATGGTTITPFSLNTSTYGPLTSFSASTTVTSGSWTAQTMQLYVEPGTYYVGATRVLFLGGSTPTVTAPSSHPRIDLVTADSSGAIALVTGSENVSPVAPSYPLNKLVLAEVYNVVGETALYDNDYQQSGQGYVYNDVRPNMAPPYISSLSQVASGLFLVDPGGEAQGAVPYQGSAALAFLAAGTSGQVLTTQGASANPKWANPSTTPFISTTTTVSSTTTQNIDTTISVSASYNLIRLHFQLQGFVSGINTTYASGWVVFAGTTSPVSGFIIANNTNGVDSTPAVPIAVGPGTNMVSGNTSASNMQVTLSITSITSSQIVVRAAFQVGSGTPSGQATFFVEAYV